MDYNDRSPQANADRGPSNAAAPTHVPRNNRHSGGASKTDKWTRIGILVAAIAVVVLLVGLIIGVYANNNNTTQTESKYIYNNKLQAVFLNTGQVYFGNIKVLNNNFLVLTNIFYLQTSSSSSSTSSSSNSSNVTLVKLGCELHQPYDEMIINRSEITFWENLQASGQVAQAVSKYYTENPNGQKCADQSTSSSSTSGSVQNAGSSNSSSTTTKP